MVGILSRGSRSLRSQKRVFLTLAGVLSLGIGCTPKKVQDPETLRMPLFSEPPTLDPQLADTGVSIFLLNQVVSTLLTYDSQHRIVPYDAQSFEWKSDGMELWVKLKVGLKWSDGFALQACQYKDGILRALDPKLPSALSDLLFEILNAKERKRGQVGEDKVRILCDDKQGLIRFFTTRPYSWKLLHGLAFVISSPIRKNIVEKRASEWLFPSPDGPGLSTAAFALKDWSRGSRLVLEARSLREKDLPVDRVAQVKHVDFPFVKDPATALTLYEGGDVDVLGEIPPAWVSKLSSRADYKIFPYLTTYMIGFSMKANPVLKDARIRQALAYTLDTDEIPKLLGGAGNAARGWIPPSLIVPEIRPSVSLYQPEKARRLLAQAGFRGGKKLPTLKLFFNSGERHQILMERIAYNWKTQLGINVELNPMEWRVLVSRLKASPPDLYRYAWAAVYPDPLFFLEIFAQNNPNNFGGWSDSNYNALLNELSMVPYEKRDAVFWKNVQRAQTILTETNPALVSVYHYVRNVLIAPTVQNLEFDWRGGAQLRLVKKATRR